MRARLRLKPYNLRPSLRRWSHVVLFVLVALAYVGGWFERVEYALMDLRFRMHERPASGELVLVEIDSESLHRLNVWPWPREWHGEVTDHLVAAGARQIAFDVDFSAHSNPESDLAFAESIEAAAGRVILPVFHQPLSATSDELVETEPLPLLADAARLASVTVSPESDSRVRRLTAVGEWQGGLLPSLPGALAGIAAETYSRFYVDFAIDAADIPRLSYADVLEGTADLSVVDGRVVLIGATAIELGDQLPAPLHLTIPGPVMLALGFESLVQQRTLQRTGALPTLVVAALLALIVSPLLTRASWRRGALRVVVIQSAMLLVAHAVYVRAAVSIDLAPWMAVLWLSYAYDIFVLVEAQAKRILAQRMAEAEHSALMTGIVDGSFDAIVTLDDSAKITHVNAAAERLFTLPQDEATGLNIDALVRLPSGAPASSLLAGGTSLAAPVEVDGLLGGESAFVGELALRRAELQLDGNLASRYAGATRFWVATVRDITDRKAAELAQAEARTAAENANRAKTEFVATMSHELRTPLNAMLGFSEMIREEMLGPVGVPQYKDYAGDIHRSGTHLLEIINDILDTAKIEAGKMTLSEDLFEVADVISNSLRLAAGRPEGREGAVPVRVELGEPLPALEADQRLVKQVLLNLITNAMKFTHEGEIVVTAALASDGWLELSVRDTGIGIAADDIEKVLQPFQQVDSSHTREYQGTGLGLSLAKSLVELHDGELTVDSEPGIGTTVTCRLPPERLAPPANGSENPAVAA